MFVYNLKINGTKAFRIIIITIIIIAIIILSLSIYNFYYKSKFVISDQLPVNSITTINNNQYTSILKQVYENVDTYVGQSINFTGYVYKLSDFKDSEFVLARDMIISSDMQTLIVGFLCDHKNAKVFADESWVELTGEITLGDYHGNMPIIKVKEIKQIEKPTNNIYVCPPDDSYVPTSAMF